MSRILSLQRTVPTGTIGGTSGVTFATSLSASNGGTVSGTELRVPAHVGTITVTATFTGLTSGTAYLAIKAGVAGSSTAPSDIEGWRIIGSGSVIGSNNQASFNGVSIGEMSSGIGFCSFVRSGSSVVTDGSGAIALG